MLIRAALALLLVGCSGASRTASSPPPSTAAGLSTPAPLVGLPDERGEPEGEPVMVGECARLGSARVKQLDRPPRMVDCPGSGAADSAVAPWVTGTTCAFDPGAQVASKRYPSLRRALAVDDLASAPACDAPALRVASEPIREAVRECFNAAGVGILLRAEVAEFFVFVALDARGVVAGVDVVGASADDQRVGRCVRDRVMGTTMMSHAVSGARATIAVDGRLEDVRPRALAPRLADTCWEAARRDGQVAEARVSVAVPAAEPSPTTGPCGVMWLVRAERLR